MVVALGAFAITGATVVTVAFIAAKWHRDSRRDSNRDELDDVATFEERLTRVEQAVAALSVDANRLIEGQRYLSQLLTERSAAPQPVGRIDRA